MERLEWILDDGDMLARRGDTRAEEVCSVDTLIFTLLLRRSIAFTIIQGLPNGYLHRRH